MTSGAAESNVSRRLPCEDDHLRLESLETNPRGAIAANPGRAKFHRENHGGTLRALGVCDRDSASRPLASRQLENNPAHLLDLFDAQCQFKYAERLLGARDGRDAGGAY